jgi:hypothetical protein
MWTFEARFDSEQEMRIYITPVEIMRMINHWIV